MLNRVFKPNSIADYLGAIFVMAAFFVGVLGFWYITSRDAQTVVPPDNIQRPVVSCQPEFLAFQELRDGQGQIVSLIPERQVMFAEGGQFVNSKVVLAKSETETSKVACGYVFIRAGTGNGALRAWENVYINPSGFGAHLKPDSAISVNDGEQFSEYLYALNKIEYWINRNRQDVYTADWAALLNVQQVVPFTIALNTEDKTGFLEEVSIAYKCWNPQTGEENKDCKLRIETSETTTGALE